MKVDGGSLEWTPDDFLYGVADAVEEAMTKSCIHVERIARQSIGGKGSGRAYKRGKKIHKASAPGRPPARDTGTLASSVSYEVSRRGFNIQGRVGPDLGKIRMRSRHTEPDYGSYLELGTSRMKARPWLKPALIRSQHKIMQYFKHSLR